MQFYLECAMRSGLAVRMLFRTRRKAENARKKITAAIEKGKFRNADHTVEIRSDASTYTLVAEEILAVSVNDAYEWLDHSAALKERAKSLGVPDAIGDA